MKKNYEKFVSEIEKIISQIQFFQKNYDFYFECEKGEKEQKSFLLKEHEGELLNIFFEGFELSKKLFLSQKAIKKGISDFNKCADDIFKNY